MLRELELLGCAAITINAEGFVDSVNSRAARLFDDAFYIRAGRLQATDPDSKNSLDKLIAKIRAGSDSQLFQIVVRRNARLPIVINAVLAGAASDPRVLISTALLLLTDLDERPTISPKFTEEVFSLTSMQAKVASLLAEGKPLDAIASDLGITPGTARNHLKAIFSRTGTSRQAELVSLLWRLR